MPDLRTPWRAVAAAFAINGVLLGTWASRIPAIVERHGLTESQLGLVLLAMGVGALISFPLAGRLADGLGAVRVTRWLAWAYLGAIVLVGLAPSIPLLAAAVFLFGASHGAMDVTMNSWATEVERSMGRSVMSSFHAMWSLGAGTGAGLGFLATSLALPVPVQFAGVAVLSALVLGPFIAMPWESARRTRQAADPVFAFPKGALVLVGVIALASGLGEGAMADWSAVYLHDIVSTTEAAATLGYTVYSVTMVAMRLLVDGLVTRFGPVGVARTSGLAATGGIALVIWAPGLPVVLAGFVLMGIGYAALIPLAFSRAGSDPEIPAGQGIASVATMAYGSMLMGPPLIGAISEASSLRIAFLLLGCFAIAVVALAPVLSRPRVAAQVA